MKRSKSLSIGLIFVLTGCSSTYRRPESIESKMARFEAKKTNGNQVPLYQIVSAPIDFKIQNERGRGPASVAASEKGPSNKRLYFLTLYSQYRNLGRFVSQSEAPDLKHCPNFHTTLVNYREHQTAKLKTSVDWKKRFSSLKDINFAHYPELSLPLSIESLRPRAGDLLQQKNRSPKYKDTQQVMHKALSLHLTKTYRELEQLCEQGASDNYYTYENLITHTKKYGFKANNNNISVLMKTTLFSNMGLIKSMENGKGVKKVKSRLPASLSSDTDYQQILIKRLNVPWAKGYFEAITKLR
jgi:hypothetical protein